MWYKAEPKWVDSVCVFVVFLWGAVLTFWPRESGAERMIRVFHPSNQIRAAGTHMHSDRTTEARNRGIGLCDANNRFAEGL